MIRSNLPKTPMEKVTLSPALNMVVGTVFFLANLFGFWKRPRKKSSANFESMSLIDKIFWGYKSQSPIILPEKGLNLEQFIRSEYSEFALPEDFLKKGSLRINAVGDLYKCENLENSKEQLYRFVEKNIFTDDVSIANLESQLTDQEISKIEFNTKDGPPICCTDQQFETLKGPLKKKFSILNTACNHTMDMGEKGLMVTLDRLSKEGILNLGTQLEPALQKQGRVVEKNGFKIGFISATYGLNGKTAPKGKEFMVNVINFHHHHPPDLSILLNQIEYCKQQNCDIIIASLHWGYEYEFFPRNEQVKTAHEIIDAGVDIIIGHHPHVIQPIEATHPKGQPGKTAIIAYSLGNLTNPFSSPHLTLSSILNVKLARGSYQGKEQVFIESAGIIPVVQVEKVVSGIPVVQIEPLGLLEKRYQNIDDEQTQTYIKQLKNYLKIVLPEA